MKLQEMSILNKLTSILNNYDSSSTDWIMASYLIENIEDLSELDIASMSDACFVSRATVRRFAMKLGYDNFLDLKTQISNTFEYSNVSYKKSGNDFYLEKKDIIKQIIDMLEEIYQKFSKTLLDELLARIYKADKLVFITSGKLYGTIKPFQEELIICGKKTFIKNEFKDRIFFEDLKENDLIFVVSASGKFYELIKEDLKKTSGSKVLLSLVDKDGDFDQLICLNKEELSDLRVDIFNKYGLSFVLDLLVNEYRRII